MKTSTLYIDLRRLDKEAVAECHRLAAPDKLGGFAPRAMHWLLVTVSQEYERRLHAEDEETTMPTIDFKPWSDGDLTAGVRVLASIITPGPRTCAALQELAFRAVCAIADEIERRLEPASG